MSRSHPVGFDRVPCQRAKVKGRVDGKVDPPAVVDLYEQLNVAADLEHGLMLTYLYSAYSLKTRWEEFQYIRSPDGTWIKNARAAIQFELLRDIKLSLINVAREEMLHLHLVNYMIRAFGGSPRFELPTIPVTGSTQVFPMTFTAWRPLGPDGNPIYVELEKCNLTQVLRFVQYESTDSLIVPLSEYLANPTAPLEKYLADPIWMNDQADRIRNVLDGTYDLNLKFQCYYAFDTANQNDARVQKLQHVWKNTPVVDNNSPRFAALSQDIDKIKETRIKESLLAIGQPPMIKTGGSSFATPMSKTDNASFRTIGAFYDDLQTRIVSLLKDNTITPIIEKVNIGIATDLAYILPVGRRGPQAQTFYDPDTGVGTQVNETTVKSMISEITEQGEGSEDFFQMLEKMEQTNWSDDDMKEFILYSTNPGGWTPTPSATGPTEAKETTKARSRTWQAHLAQFSRVLGALQHETALCKLQGLDFDPARRDPIQGLPPELQGAVLVQYFNLMFLILQVLLRRLYFVYDDDGVAEQVAISNVATWSLMSMTVRPMLELLSLVEHAPEKLFAQPQISGEAQKDIDKLVQYGLKSCPTQALERNTETDEAIQRLLDRVVVWAQGLVDWLGKESGNSLTWQGTEPQLNPSEIARGMLFRRLHCIRTSARELFRQVTFRTENGGSDEPSNTPSLNEVQTYKCSENPVFSSFSQGDETAVGQYRTKLYPKDMKMLRLRFSGWVPMMLATDPDATSEEVGITGYFLSRYGEAPLDRSLLFNGTPYVAHGETTIEHTYPRRQLALTGKYKYTPKPGVAFATTATVLQLSSDISGKDIQSWFGATDLDLMKLDLPSSYERRVSVKSDLSFQPIFFPPPPGYSVAGQHPHLVGENTLVWIQGEPMDFARLTVTHQSNTLLGRTMNGDTRFIDMEPQQRAVSGRAPIAKDSAYNSPNFYMKAVAQVPEWARDDYFKWYHKDAVEWDPLSSLDIPESTTIDDFLRRANDLMMLVEDRLQSVRLDQTPSSDAIDAITFALRRHAILYKRSQPFTFFDAYMQYTHTISGEQVGALQDLISSPNAQGLQATDQWPWLVRYCFGSLDPDAGGLLHTFGELYVPVVGDIETESSGTDDTPLCGCEVM